MVIKYDVTVQPVKLMCNSCRRGATYVLSYERRTSAEYVSQPQPCTKDGEVVFGKSSDAIIVPSFILNIESAKDKKLLTIALYDFSRRPKVERLFEFEVPLGDQVDAMSRESFCALRQFPFRSGKFQGTLLVTLRMFPVGDPIPTMIPTQPTSLIKGEDIQRMQEEKLIPLTVAELEGDVDLIEELRTKLQELSRARQLKKSIDPRVQERQQRKAELQMLLDEIEAAERRDGGRGQLDSADRHMLELLEEEARAWQGAAVIPDDRSPNAPQEKQPPTSTPATSPTQAGLVQELELQKLQLQRHLEALEHQQSRRDVTKEAIDALDAIKHLETVIEETKKANRTTHTAAGGAGAGSRSVRFKEDTDDNTPVGLAQRLLRAHSEREAAEYSFKVLESIKNNPYDGLARMMEDLHAVPPPTELRGIGQNKRRGVPPSVRTAPLTGRVVPPATSSQPARSNDLLADLFATAPPSSVVQPRAATQAASTGAALDDLFGAPAPKQQPAAQVHRDPGPTQVQPQQPKSNPPPAQPAPSQPQATPAVPKFDVLPLPTTTSPTALTRFPTITVRCRAVKFSDYTNTKFVRGTELEFVNSGPADIIVGDVAVMQEDIFASVETAIPSKSNQPRVTVRSGGAPAVLYLSFGSTTTMLNAMMAVLRLSVAVGGTAPVPDSVRVSL